MTPQETATLRKDIKKMLVDLDLDSRRKGAMAILSADMTARMQKPVSRSTLAMALSGSRDTEAYHKLLVECRAMLAERLPVSGDIIHG